MKAATGGYMCPTSYVREITIIAAAVLMLQSAFGQSKGGPTTQPVGGGAGTGAGTITTPGRNTPSINTQTNPQQTNPNTPQSNHLLHQLFTQMSIHNRQLRRLVTHRKDQAI